MSYNILNKGVKFQGDTQGTIEDIVDNHSTQTIGGLKTITHLTGTHVKVTNDINVLGNVSASVNISASFFYGDGSTLSNIDSISFDGSTANGLLTFKDADEATVESNLTFDGSTLDFKTTSISGSGNISGSAFYGNGAGLTGILGSAVTLASGGGITDSSGLKLDVGVDAVGSLNTADKILIFDADDGDAVKRTTAGAIAGLFDPVVSTFNGQTLHRVVTVGGAETIDGEANLTFNGTVLAVTGQISGSSVVSGTIGHFVTTVEAGAVSLGDASGLAGLGLANASGELDIQVSGAVKIASDKLGITGSFAGNGLLYEGGVDSISSIGIDLASSSGLQLSGGELSVNLNSLGTATPLFSADSIVFIDADDGSTKKSGFSNFVATMAGDGLVNNSGRFDINVSGAMALQSDKLVLSSSVAGNGLEVAAGDGQMVNTLSVKVSDFMGNGVNNRIVTAADANSMNAEAKFTFDDTTLILTGSSIFSGSTTTFDTTEFIIQSATSEKPTLELKNTTPSDTNGGAIMSFTKVPSDNVGETDDNILGGIKFNGIDSGNSATTYGQFTVHSSDKSGGDEAGEFRFKVMAGGTAGAAGLVELLTIGGEDTNASTPCEVIVNEAAIDCDFRVESADETHMLFVDAANSRVSIGDSADAPAATLEITNHASAGATGVPLLQLNSNDGDKIALDINAANATANVVDIVADTLTTAAALSVTSNSSNAISDRSLVKITNDHADAAKAIPLDIKNDAETTDAGGVSLIKMTAGTGGDVLALKAKTATIATPSGAVTKTTSNFFPAGCIPVGFAIKVTTVIPGSKFVTKIGIAGSLDYAFGHLTNAGSGGGGLGTTDDLQAEDDLKLSAPKNDGERFFEAATDLTVTFDGDPGATSGVIRFTMYYYQMDVG